MLRLRLLYGLLTLTLLFWGVGAASLLLMRDSGKKFERQLKADYASIDAAQTFRSFTATLNNQYISLLGGPPPDPPPDDTFFRRTKEDMLAQRDMIRGPGRPDPQTQGVLERFNQALDLYFEGYERIFDGSATTREERSNLLISISGHTQSLVQLSDSLISLAEMQLFMGAGSLQEEARKNRLFIITLTVLGTVIAVLIYMQLVRHLVDPVEGLRHSMEEVRKGNFELTIPEPGNDSEFAALVSAFNDMAAELRVRRGETDEYLVRANLVNRAILASIPSPVFILADDDGIMQINPAAEELSERLGVTGRLPIKIQRILDQCREDGAHFLPEDPREALLFRIDEEEFYYLPRIFRFVAEDGSRSGWAILLHNVSRIRWLDDMKTNLISTVSHEIKTPLTGIRMVLHLLLEERNGKLDEMQRTMVTSANDDCERLLKTLNTLLDLSRAESGATHLERIPISLEQCIDRATSLFAEAAAAKGLQFQKELPGGGLPEVAGDPVRLDEVINNLVSNAIKHSPGNESITFRVSKQGSDYLRLSVIDRGPGVPESIQDRLFERFFRAPGQKVDGVGLGLFISREIMRAHEGRIGLGERMGNQTEFFIDVPIA